MVQTQSARDQEVKFLMLTQWGSSELRVKNIKSYVYFKIYGRNPIFFKFI